MKVLRLIRRAARRVDEIAAALELPGTLDRVEKRTDFSNCPRPVLLLHGFFASRRTFDILERRLRRDGYGVFSLHLGGFGGAFNTRGIDEVADLVRAKIERIYARNPGMGPLTIVGHSKGGLVAAYYVKRLGGWRRTRAVVTLGAPHHGTPLAYLGLPLGGLSRSVVADDARERLPRAAARRTVAGAGAARVDLVAPGRLGAVPDQRHRDPRAPAPRERRGEGRPRRVRHEQADVPGDPGGDQGRRGRGAGRARPAHRDARAAAGGTPPPATSRRERGAGTDAA